jgi:hypothetical protein
VERLSARERERIAELLAEGAPFWRLCEEVGRSRHAVRRAVLALSRPAPRERKRSPLRLSPAEREEISRGLAHGQPPQPSVTGERMMHEPGLRSDAVLGSVQFSDSASTASTEWLSRRARY